MHFEPNEQSLMIPANLEKYSDPIAHKERIVHQMKFSTAKNTIVAEVSLSYYICCTLFLCICISLEF